MQSTNKFVISLVGMALSAALLILLIPSRIQETGNSATPLIVLAALAIAFAAGTRHWRPRRDP